MANKGLPNGPHLSKYDGLGDAGIIMAINEKHRKNDSYSYQDNNDICDILADARQLAKNINNDIMELEKEEEKRCRDAYIEGYKQCKRDLKKKVYRSPYLAFIEYWDRQSQ